MGDTLKIHEFVNYFEGVLYGVHIIVKSCLMDVCLTFGMSDAMGMTVNIKMLITHKAYGSNI